MATCSLRRRTCFHTALRLQPNKAARSSPEWKRPSDRALNTSVTSVMDRPGGRTQPALATCQHVLRQMRRIQPVEIHRVGRGRLYRQLHSAQAITPEDRQFNGAPNGETREQLFQRVLGAAFALDRDQQITWREANLLRCAVGSRPCPPGPGHPAHLVCAPRQGFTAWTVLGRST